jgi:lipopolysaccharide/colanic/teichoic acid biosynthesis glycosyltransferase
MIGRIITIIGALIGIFLLSLLTAIVMLFLRLGEDEEKVF